MTETRTDKVAKNMRIAVICQVLMTLVNFVLRKVFVVSLGQTYLGLNGIFADILAMLSVAELGFGTSIIFSLYKPVAEGDTEKIKSLMRLYRNIYRIVGAFVLTVGLALTPFLDFFVKERPVIPESLELIYILNVVNSAASYFFIYKASLLFADQKKYVEMLITAGTKFVAAMLEIAVLLITGNYILYLVVVITGTLAQNILISYRVNKMYPYMNDESVSKLPDEDKAVIKKNVGAMVYHKLGSVVIFSTDSILVSKLVGVESVGIYSNYTLIKNALKSVIEPAFAGITSGFGNLNASEGYEKSYNAFKNVEFFSAWVFGFCSICLMCLFNPFITLWLGADYTFNNVIVLLIVISFYLSMMRLPVKAEQDAMGLFSQNKYAPIPECIINLVLSVIWALQFEKAFGPEYGVAGIVLGTIASTVLVPFWVEPLVIFKYGLKKGQGMYYLKYFGYMFITAVTGVGTFALCNLMPDGILGFLFKCVICIAVPNMIFAACYMRTPEFKFIKDYIIQKVNNKIGKKHE